MNKQPAVDNDGFLLDPDEWSEEFALHKASEMEIKLSDDHWHVISFIRDEYERTLKVPELRHVRKFLKETYGEEKASRKFIYSLFPYGYGQQGCLLAGMRQPKKLWLDL